jgi:polar amino acid transport system substrate-binding protein
LSKQFAQKRNWILALQIMKYFLIFTTFTFLLFPIHVLATQNNSLENSLSQKQTQIRLGTRIIEPFVVEENNKYSGFSIELWNELAQRLNLQTSETKAYSNVQNLLESVDQNQVDVGIAAISITSEREEKLDFSYPMFKSGLGILTTNQSNQSQATQIFGQIWKVIWSRDFAIFCLWVVLISMIPATLIYFLERRKIDGFLDTRNPIEGILQAYWWGITALTGQQEKQPATKSGRLFGVFWMFFGVLFISFFTAQITSNLTAEKLHSEITSLEDLKGKKVSTVKASTATKFLMEKEISSLEKETVKEAIQALENNEVTAVVYDSPSLEYFAKQNGGDKFVLVGGLLTTEDYGIALPKNSELRKLINQELLKIQESGQYSKLREKWFGSK